MLSAIHLSTPQPGQRCHALGRLIAVSPTGHAVAVAAAKGRLALLPACGQQRGLGGRILDHDPVRAAPWGSCIFKICCMKPMGIGKL